MNESIPARHGRTRRSHGRPSRRAWLPSRLSRALTSERSRFAVMMVFVVLVALMGGGSRSDIQSLLILRPASVLFATYAAMLITADELRRVRAPLLIVGAIMAIALFQLIPLPAGLWSVLDNREAVSRISAVLGTDDITRPISLDPNRTWNAFFALFVPLAAIGLYAIQTPDYRRKASLALVGVAGASAVVALLQAFGADALYFYRITNSEVSVGLFANRNHQAIFLLWLMLAVSFVAQSKTQRQSARTLLGVAVGLILVLVPLLILTGSRAGLVLCAPVLAVSIWLLMRSPAVSRVISKGGRKAKMIVAGLFVAIAAQIALTFVVLASSGRSTAISRMLSNDLDDELRFNFLDIYQRMVVDFMPFGAGLGSFESIFRRYEPATSLTTRYMNQAHNEFAQIAMEGGAPMVVVLLAALTYLIVALYKLWRKPEGRGRTSAIYYGSTILLWSAASVVDYPLRTPLAAMIIAVLTAQLSFLSTAARSGSGSPDQ